jgi:dienelactone hydrolase
MLFLLIPGNAGPQLEVQPTRALMDQELTIRATGLEPGQPAILRAEMPDKNGDMWRSSAGFHADRHGVIDLTVHAPENGDYHGVLPMGLIYAANLPVASRGPSSYMYPTDTPIPVTVSLETGGTILDRVTVTRSFMRDGVVVRKVEEQGLRGWLYLPPLTSSTPAVIVLGGSEGGHSAAENAMLLASHGYAALALAYFGVEGLPESLAEIPMEYFIRGVDLLQAQPSVDNDLIGVLGTSKGAEAALLLASLDGRLKTVVAYTPSAFVWSCICRDEKSSWTYDGRPVDFIRTQSDPTYAPEPGYPVSFVIHYRYRYGHARDLASKIIPVENIQGDVLLISGKKDLLFPSDEMASMIMDRLRQKRFRYRSKHLSYENTGHRIRKSYMPWANSSATARGWLLLGGTDAGNAHAQADSWPQVLEFLEESLRKRR